MPFSYSWTLGAHGPTESYLNCCIFSISELDAETVVVLTSRSGESVEVAKLSGCWRDERGAKVIGVTNVTRSSLDKGADVSILVGSPADEMVAIQTYTATVAVFALLDATMKGDLDAAAADLEQTAETLESWIPECISARINWDRFLAGDRPLYLLGRGTGIRFRSRRSAADA